MSILQQTRPATKSSRKPLDVALTLCINGQCYDVTPQAHAPGSVKSYRLVKVGGDSAVYDLDASADRIVCTCPSYEKSYAGTSSLCKHGRALVMVGLVDYPDAKGTHSTRTLAPVHVPDEFDEPLTLSSSEGHSAPVAKPPLHPTTYDPQWQDALAAVSSGRAIWIDHRHLHTREPLPAPKMTIGTDDSHSAKGISSTDTPCCPDDEPAPCSACLVHDGPADLSDDAWDDDYVWSTCDFVPDPDDDEDVRRRQDDAALDAVRELRDDWLVDRPDDGEDDEPEARTLAEQVDVEARHYRTLGSPFGELIAATLEKLAAEVRYLDASTPAAYFDRREAALDAARDAAGARTATRCC